MKQRIYTWNHPAKTAVLFSILIPLVLAPLPAQENRGAAGELRRSVTGARVNQAGNPRVRFESRDAAFMRNARVSRTNEDEGQADTRARRGQPARATSATPVTRVADSHRDGNRPAAGQRYDRNRESWRRDRDYRVDSYRQNHSRDYASRDYRGDNRYRPWSVRKVVRRYIPLTYSGGNYYYSNGSFFRYTGSGFSLVFGNVGRHLGRLPYGYRTVYIAGFPYYYYDNRYYVHDLSRNMYVNVDNPYRNSALDESGSSIGYDELYVYPQQGQSAEEMDQDRYECHVWAVSQTGFDPSLGQPGEIEDYQRAWSACLEGRGYVVN